MGSVSIPINFISENGIIAVLGDEGRGVSFPMNSIGCCEQK